MAAINANVLLSFPFKLLGDFDRWVWRSGTWGLRSPIKEIAYHVADSLPPKDGEKLRAQLSQFLFHSWYIDGRINEIHHYAFDPKNLMDGDPYLESLFRIAISIDNKKHHANAIFYLGRLRSVELPKPIEFYRGQELQLGAVTRGNPQSTMMRAIDRLEHGHEPE